MDERLRGINGLLDTEQSPIGVRVVPLHRLIDVAEAAAELQQPDYTPRPGAPAQQELGLPGLDFQPGLVAQRARLLLGRSGKRSGTDGFFDLNSRFGWGSGCTHRGWTLGSVLWWWTG